MYNNTIQNIAMVTINMSILTIIPKNYLNATRYSDPYFTSILDLYLSTFYDQQFDAGTYASYPSLLFLAKLA
jgi:hypothetical protein